MGTIEDDKVTIAEVLNVYAFALDARQLCTVDGDTANAFSYGNWLLVREAADGGPTWRGTGYYDDELVRTSRGWRIQRRVCRLLSWRGNPSVPEPQREHNPDMNARGLHDFASAGEISYLKAITTK